MHYDENNVKKIDTTLEYHVAHSNPHMLFEKMVELGFAPVILMHLRNVGIL